METEHYRNPALPADKRAELLFAELTLDEKMAQVNCVFPFDRTYLDPNWISAQVPYGIGEVSTLEMRRIKTLEEAAAWTRKVQTIVMENSPPPHSCHFSYGRSLRTLYPGYRQLPGWDSQRLFL